MFPSLKPQQLKRYKDIALLLFKYGRSDWVRNAGLEEVLAGEAPTDNGKAFADGSQFAADLEKLGPTFIKLGQLLSTRPDFVPLPFLQSLARLQDKVEPFPTRQVKSIIAAELGVGVSKVFSSFRRTPLASASLGQVHRAALKGGTPVAVKVQRPGIRRQIAQDLQALNTIATFLEKHTEFGRRYQLCNLLQEFRKSILRELDYRQEARNLSLLGDNMKSFELIVVPRAIEDCTTSRVLTMDFIQGSKLNSLGPARRRRLDGGALADQLFRAYLKQILVDGFVHADPHPGNVFLTDDGRIALLDLGMTQRVTPTMQEKLLELILGFSEGRGEDVAQVALEIGQTSRDFQANLFRRKVAVFVGEHQDVNIVELQIGKLLLEFVQLCADCDMQMPHELAMLGKTLLNLDEIGRALDPSFDPNDSIRRNAPDIVQQHMIKTTSPGAVLTSLLEVKDFAQKLPGRMSRILDHIADNDLKLDVDAIDEHRLMTGLQKIANRITLGLILAALIVGAALLMRVETDFRILGYPGLAILCFLCAAAGGLALIFTILVRDERP
jgi:ubiquinone biosynthesis protein